MAKSINLSLTNNIIATNMFAIGIKHTQENKPELTKSHNLMVLFFNCIISHITIIANETITVSS